MAPVETHAAAHSNNLPVVLFGGQTLLVAGLSAHVLLTTRRAARALPPATRTRAQNNVRRRHARIFSALALLALVGVTAFAVAWRVVSYVQWAELGSHDAPGSLWHGWYGTGNWLLGDWIRDVDLARESDAVAVLAPEGFYYTAQHFVALVASAVFIGVEGHRRNLSPWTVAAFVTLAPSDTPLTDALFTPRPAVYWTPIVLALLGLNEFPNLVVHRDVFHILRVGYIAVPLFLAFAPQLTPVALGVSHPTKAHAHRSYATVFHFLAIVSFVFYARVFYLSMRDTVPAPPNPVWEVFANAVGRDTSRTNRLLQGLDAATRKLSKVSRHPALSVTSLDVLFTGVALLTWTFTRDLDIEALLASSILSPLVPKHREHVRFFEPIIKKLDAATNLSDPAETIPTTAPKKRGRKSNAIKAAEAAAAAPDIPESPQQSVRRRTRRTALAAFDDAVESVTGSPTPQSQTLDAFAQTHPADDPADASFVPDEQTQRDVEQTEVNGADTEGEYLEAAESTALAMFLTVLGGLGQLACAALGAEVAGPLECAVEDLVMVL
ncbi:hypothetical protein EJ07DRAFT_162175 [Lizonia empirigonia]|nr:hypothetical protein EJ07DRAFT_162175 [Lizonia empirigonia]